jgi:hypothetical protein
MLRFASQLIALTFEVSSSRLSFDAIKKLPIKQSKEKKMMSFSKKQTF